MPTRARDDFLTDEQRMIRDTARDFARAELAPHAGEWEDQGWIPDEVVAKMGELGLLGMTVPPEWGGTGADYVSVGALTHSAPAADISFEIEPA